MRKARGAARATNVSKPCALAFEVNDEGWPGGRGSPGFALRVMNSPHVPLRNIVSNIRSLALRDPAARARNGVQPRNADQARCRSWVNRFTLTVGQPLPILPQLRTCRCTAPTDAMCQKQKKCARSGLAAKFDTVAKLGSGNFPVKMVGDLLASR